MYTHKTWNVLYDIFTKLYRCDVMAEQYEENKITQTNAPS